MKKLATAAFAATLLLPAQTRAADYSLLLMGPSYHTLRADNQGRIYNNSNEGLGVRVRLRQKNYLSLGAYRNSYSHPSVFAEYDFMPVSFGKFQAGLGVGIVTGYQRYLAGGAITPLAGVVASYAFSPNSMLLVRAIPLFNGRTWGGSAKHGVVFNFALSVKLE